MSSPAGDEPVLRTERDGTTLIITIDRPKARNSVNTAVAEGIAAALDELDDDDALVAGILTGAGGFFSAGMDLKAFLRGERPHVGDRGFAGITAAPAVEAADRRGRGAGAGRRVRARAVLRPRRGLGGGDVRDPGGQARARRRGRRPDAPARPHPAHASPWSSRSPATR